MEPESPLQCLQDPATGPVPVAVTFLTRIRICYVRISTGTQALLTDVFRDFPQSSGKRRENI